MKKAIAAVIVLIFVFAAGIFMGAEMGSKTRMEIAEAAAYEIQLALPQHRVSAVDIDKLGPNIMVTDGNQNPDMIARIEVGMGGELYPIYWDKATGAHAYHWNEEESVNDIIAKLSEQS